MRLAMGHLVLFLLWRVVAAFSCRGCLAIERLLYENR